MSKNFLISKKEYSTYVKYFSFLGKDSILDFINQKLENHLKKKSISKIDILFKNSTDYYLNIFYLDFLSKFFFKKSLIRFKLNLVIASHEADYENFNKVINETKLLNFFFDIPKFLFVIITSPLWLLSIWLKSIFTKNDKI